MFDVLVHPKLVHLPIALALLMPLVGGGLLLAWVRGWFPRRTWIVAVLLQGVLAASAYAALKSGEVDEEVAENVVSEDALEEHEEYAEKFLIAGIVALVLAAAGMVFPNETVARGLAASSVAGTLVVFWLAWETGQHGGKLVYELGAANAHILENGGTIPVERTGGSDDDHGGERDDDD
jgi:uncharacterized membrane protein